MKSKISQYVLVILAAFFSLSAMRALIAAAIAYHKDAAHPHQPLIAGIIFTVISVGLFRALIKRTNNIHTAQA